MQHKILIVSQDEDLYHEIAKSLQETSAEIHRACTYQETLNKIA